jgi:hypothetical protein
MALRPDVSEDIDFPLPVIIPPMLHIIWAWWDRPFG